jgi:hypothetical protein
LSLAINNGLAFTSSRHDGTQVSASLSSSKALRPRREHHVRRLSEGEVGVVHVPRGNTATSLNVVSWAPERKGLARPLNAPGASEADLRRGPLGALVGHSFSERRVVPRGRPKLVLSPRALRPREGCFGPLGGCACFVLFMPARLPPREPQGTSGAVLEHLRRAAAKKDPPRLARSTMEQRS